MPTYTALDHWARSNFAKPLILALTILAAFGIRYPV